MTANIYDMPTHESMGKNRRRSKERSRGHDDRRKRANHRAMRQLRKGKQHGNDNG